MAANNYASSLIYVERFEEAKTLMREMLPVAQRVLGDSNQLTLQMRWVYAQTFYKDNAATLDDLREAVKTLEEVAPTARQVFGGAHPLTTAFENSLRDARATLRVREAQGEAQDAFRTARVKLAQERSELAQTLADAS